MNKEGSILEGIPIHHYNNFYIWKEYFTNFNAFYMSNYYIKINMQYMYRPLIFSIN